MNYPEQQRPSSFVFDEFYETQLHEPSGELGRFFTNDNVGFTVREMRTFEWLQLTALNLGGIATVSQNGELSSEARAHNTQVSYKDNPVGKRIFAVVIHGVSEERYMHGLLHLDPLGNREQY